MKSRVGRFVIGLLFVPVMLVASGKTYKSQVTFNTDVKVASTVLKAGEYAVAADDKQVTFTRLVEGLQGPGDWEISRDKPLVVPAVTAPLPKKVEITEAEIPVDASGVHVLATLNIRGASVQYKFN